MGSSWNKKSEVRKLFDNQLTIAGNQLRDSIVKGSSSINLQLSPGDKNQ